MEEQKIKWSIDEGNEFFAHEASINFTPLQLMFDFKSITPRVDARSQFGPTFKLRHNLVIFEPFHAKRFHDLLGNVLVRYEKEFGKIKRPKQFAVIEKKSEDKKEGAKEGPTYFG